MRVVVIAASKHPVAEPFAGGLESLTWHLVSGLRRRGVDVTLFAGPGSDPRLGASRLDVAPLRLSEAARSDVSMVPEVWLREHHAYLQVMLALQREVDVDLIHNNSLHHLPIAMSGTVAAPMLTTLHTPPTPWLEPAIEIASRARKALHSNEFVAVSEYTAAQWSHVTQAQVIHNGVDVERWTPGPGGDSLAWVGRIVPEKAPHRAVEMARAAGRPLRIAGPIGDGAYFRTQLAPSLGGDIQYLGHLGTDALVSLVGGSAATLVTPEWDEPYGLVAAESLACGTPVVALDRGGLQEFVVPGTGVLIDPVSSATEAADAIEHATRLDRADCRAHATRSCSVERMVEDYLGLYESLVHLPGGSVIGYYAHHQGLGHVTRLQAIASHLKSPVTGLSSLPAPVGWSQPWLRLDRDDAGGATADTDHTAYGVLHWVPRHDRGLAARMATVADWVRRAQPALVVVDVSVEIAALVRLCGVPVVVLAMPGVRSDRAHALAYDLADVLLAPWPSGAHTSGWPEAWHDKLRAVGGMSRFDGMAPSAEAIEGRVLLLWGSGGRGTSATDVLEARRATPTWEWVERGPESPSTDLWADLLSADVVVTHGGQNAVAEVAAARRPAVVVAQPRPFDEQAATAAAVERLGIAVGVDSWPEPGAWADLLTRARRRGGDGWSRWSSGHGASDAATLLDELAGRHTGGACVRAVS